MFVFCIYQVVAMGIKVSTEDSNLSVKQALHACKSILFSTAHILNLSLYNFAELLSCHIWFCYLQVLQPHIYTTHYQVLTLILLYIQYKVFDFYYTM